MKTKITFILILSFLFSISFANAQVVVSNDNSKVTFQKSKKRTPSKFDMKRGQTKNLNYFVFAGNAYTFDVVPANKLGNVNFRITNEEGDMLFDNSLVSYSYSAIVYAETSQRIIVSITTQPSKFFQSKKKEYDVKVKVSYSKTNNIEL